MAEYNLVWLKLSLEDLKNIQEYYTEMATLDVANNILLKIYTSAQRLKTSPRMGKISLKNSDLRELIVPKSPYIVPYRINDMDIEILRVFDGRQNPINSWV